VKVKKWHAEEHSRLKKRAREENVEIHWSDKTGRKNQSNHGRSYEPREKTPIKESASGQFKINMISTVGNRGKVQFMIYSDNINADRSMDVIKQLIKSREREIFFILDNLRVHHSHIVKEWVKNEEVKEKLEVFWHHLIRPNSIPTSI
jgi:hypothetical protein